MAGGAVVLIRAISDVHARTEGLAQSADGADVFICLGDLILFLDYEDPAIGVFADLFGEVNARRYIDLRTRRKYDEARSFSRDLWGAVGGDIWRTINERVGQQYAETFAAMPAGFLTYGNVDLPVLWPTYARADHEIVDGEAVDVGGLRVGFVGGGLRSAMRTPFELDPEEFDAKVAKLGPVDVLCSHIPPDFPDCTYDVVARRFERGSQALLRYIRDVQPRYALHGHVHQPLVPRVTIGRTQVVNVGHFRSSGKAFEVRL
ncbi:MAG: metallophosphoesterase [Candidatus Nanopelagicales bacterium]|nr:metallophosphoesterase [Candidatus Nanopelagicales bacterium]